MLPARLTSAIKDGGRQGEMCSVSVDRHRFVSNFSAHVILVFFNSRSGSALGRYYARRGADRPAAWHLVGNYPR